MIATPVIDMHVGRLMASLLVHLNLQLLQLQEQKLDYVTTRTGSWLREKVHLSQLVLQLLQFRFKPHEFCRPENKSVPLSIDLRTSS